MTGVTEELFMCQTFMCLFLSLMRRKMIAEPNLIIFQLILVVSVLELLNRIVSGFHQSR